MVFLVWIIFSLVVGYYASTTGKSFGLYFILSMLISPLLAFIIAAVKK